MAPTYRIATIQLYSKPADCEANFSQASKYVASAAEQKADLAVLPEYHLTGWIPENPEFSVLATRWRDYLERYCALAKQHNICLVPGTIVENHEDDDLNGKPGLINVAYFISNTGEILGRYQKKNLWHPEREHLVSSASEPHVAFDTPLGKVGMLICWDLAFPEAFRELIAAGADVTSQDASQGGAKIIIVPTCWGLNDLSTAGLNFNPRSEALFLSTMVTARAFENTCCVVFVNAGKHREHSNDGFFAGLSRVAVPFIGARGDQTMNTADEGMSIVDVDMEILEEAERNYKIREDLAKEGWHYTYRHQNQATS